MKFLVVGLGSMGKRRVRNLLALDHKDIAGFDNRKDRLEESSQKYRIQTFADFQQALAAFKPDALIVSTPPDIHMEYAYKAYELGIDCFIEASVTHAEEILKLHKLLAQKDTVIVPSCTMRYFPGPKKVKELVAKGVVGKILNVNYHTGQYLPDWHPWEDIKDFYVSKKETGGCREIVPFELAWLNDIFGRPRPLSAFKAKLSDMKADIDDIYHCLLGYDKGVIANITIEILSRPAATRELRVLGSEGILVFSADDNCIKYINTSSKKWEHLALGCGTMEQQYINPEEPYIEEIGDFIKAVLEKDRSVFPNTLLDDYDVLKTLRELEEMATRSE